MSEQAGRYQRSFSGMVGAMIILVLLVGGYVFLRSLTTRNPPSPVHTVAFGQSAAYARKSADFTVLAPRRLPAGWRATTVGFTPKPDEHWHLGVLTNHTRYVGLEQGRSPVSSMLHSYVGANPVKGTSAQVLDRPWATYQASGGDLAFVNRQDGTTTLVVGHDVPRAELASYIATFH